MDCCVEEVQIEGGVVVYQYCVLVMVVVYGQVYFVKYVVQCYLFVQCFVQWVVWVDVGDFQCVWIEVGVWEGFDMGGNCWLWVQVVFVIYVQGDGGDFQQGVVFGVEVVGFYVYYYWQKVVEVVGYVVGQVFVEVIY